MMEFLKVTPLKLALALCLGLSAPALLRAQGTAFTYQGRLNAGGFATTGVYDFRFRLAADALGNTYVGSSFVTNGIGVTNGLFMTPVDFGPGILNGSNYWLEVEVRTNGATGYSALFPLQLLTPTPYAIFATTANNVAGTISAGQISGGTLVNSVLPGSATFSGAVAANSFSGNGANVTNVNAAALNGMTSANFWQLGGNNVAAGKFLGSTNNQPVELWVNNARALRLEATAASSFLAGIGYTNLNGAPNFVAGSPVNFVSNGVVGATIGGGGATNYFGTAFTNSVNGDFGTVSGGVSNTVTGPEGTVSGGFENTGGSEATVGGGANNVASGQSATVAGGANNVASGEDTTVGGGINNVANLTGATVGGGYVNQATSIYATVPGGADNYASGYASFAAGLQAQAIHSGAFVWADAQGTPFFSTGANQFLIRAQGGMGINTNDPAGAALNVNGTASATTFVAGSIGLGTSPAWAVDVLASQAVIRLITTNNSSGADIELKNTSSGTTTLGAINFNNAANGYPGQIAYSSGNTMAFRVAGNGNAMLLTSSSLTVNGTFVSSSDRNLKQDFQPVDSRSVLEKVSQLPVQTWTYKNDPGTKHLGPMAQDFYAAFGTGADDRHIAVVDEGGVALAAIQGLNQKLEQQEVENAELKKQLADLQILVRQLAQDKLK